jgi:hypothetical protein
VKKICLTGVSGIQSCRVRVWIGVFGIAFEDAAPSAPLR